MTKQVLFRNDKGEVSEMLDKVEWYSFSSDPLAFLVDIARYKFIGRMLKHTDIVIDVGCGSAVGSVMLSKFCAKVIAIDIDAELIDKNVERYSSITNLEFHVFDPSKYEMSVFQAYDVAVCVDVIEHIDPKVRPFFLQNLMEPLPDYGLSFIGTDNAVSAPFASWRRKESHQYGEYSYDSFRKELADYYRRVFMFSGTDEFVNTSFGPLSWHMLAMCIK